MDPIADMITVIRNAGNAGIDKVSVPHSKMKESIAAVLKKEGFIKDFKKSLRREKPVLEIDLIMENRVPKIQGSRRMSKTSKRVYKSASEIRPVRNGYGILVMTTPKGVMSGYEAKKARLGGEVLFSIW